MFQARLGSRLFGAYAGARDALVAIDGIALPGAARQPDVADFARTSLVQHRVAQGFAGGNATLSVLRAGAAIELQIRARPACPTLFQVVPDAAMNGAADGIYVQVSSDLVALAQSDDELAALLAHELAHNILGHKARLDALHVDRGLLAGFGRNARLIRATEAEADRLSLYLLARAGYKPAPAIDFWKRLRQATNVIGGDPTHPRWSDRLGAMQREIDRIAAAGVPADAVPLPSDLARELPRLRSASVPP